MIEKKRPPRFDDIVALSKQPPKRAPAVSPFADITSNPLDWPKDDQPKTVTATERPDPAGLHKVSESDFPTIPAPVENRDYVGTQSTHLGTRGLGRLGTQATQYTQDLLGTLPGGQNPPVIDQKTLPLAKRKDTREQLNLKLPEEITENLRRYAFENRMTVTDVVVKSVKLLMGTRSTLGTQSAVGRNLPTFDDDIDDDDGPTIELYEKTTGNTFTANDRACLNEYKSLGHDCVQLAILLGRSRYRGKQINSFRFFEKIIKEVAAWQPDKISKELQFQYMQFKRRSR